MIRWRNGRPIVEVWNPATGEKTHVKPRDYGMDFKGLKSGSKELKRAAQELEKLAELAMERGAPKATEETCDSFAARWIADYQQRRGEATQEVNRERLKKFALDFAGRPLGGIDRQEARQWARHNQYRLPAVRAMFNDAISDRIVDHNPFANLGLAESKGRKDIVVLSYDEVHRLADTAVECFGPEYGPELRSLILWAAYTMLRPGEVFASRYSKLDGDTYLVDEQFNSKLGRTTAPKHGSVGRIFVPEVARRAVLDRPRRLNDDLMFRTRQGKQFSVGGFGYWWKPVRAAFYKTLPEGHALLRRQQADPTDLLTPHELRHAGASYQLNTLGLEPWVIAKALRHSDGGRLVTTLYGHPDEQEAIRRTREAWRRAQGENVRHLRPAGEEAI